MSHWANLPRTTALSCRRVILPQHTICPCNLQTAFACVVARDTAVALLGCPAQPQTSTRLLSRCSPWCNRLAPSLPV